MQSFIINGGSQDSRAKYLSDLNHSQTELIHLFAQKSSITIKQIQELNGPLSIAARLPRIVWIEEANLMTVPAQNALLKMLEEPPEHTSFYLTCTSASALLPTIRSRATQINLTSTKSTATTLNLSELKQIMALTPGDRLGAIVKRDRAESIAWITQIESELKAKLQSHDLSSANLQALAKIARAALQAHRELLANCSVSLVTQNFYLTLPHTHSTT